MWMVSLPWIIAIYPVAADIARTMDQSWQPRFNNKLCTKCKSCVNIGITCEVTLIERKLTKMLCCWRWNSINEFPVLCSSVLCRLLMSLYY